MKFILHKWKKTTKYKHAAIFNAQWRTSGKGYTWRCIAISRVTTHRLPSTHMHGDVATLSDLRFIGRGFEFCLSTIAQWSWASYWHLCASVTKQYNLVLVKERWRSEAEKVTVGLVIHWPRGGGPFLIYAYPGFSLSGCIFLLPKSWRPFSVDSERQGVVKKLAVDRRTPWWRGPLPLYNRHNG